jgi:hypothetical protein
VTLLHPTITIATAATLPTISAAIRSRVHTSRPLRTVCRRYRFGLPTVRSLPSAPRRCGYGRIGERWGYAHPKSAKISLREERTNICADRVGTAY